MTSKNVKRMRTVQEPSSDVYRCRGIPAAGVKPHDVQSIDEMSKNNNTPSGVHNVCKACSREVTRRHRRDRAHGIVPAPKPRPPRILDDNKWRCRGWDGNEHAVEKDALSPNAGMKHGFGTICNQCRTVLDVKRDKEKHAISLYRYMTHNSKLRNHPPPAFTRDEFIEFYLNGTEYRISPEIAFPIYQGAGYHNSSSPDRINDPLPYTFPNLHMVPAFLNTPVKATIEQLRDAFQWRPRIETETIEIGKTLARSGINDECRFFRLVRSAKTSCKVKSRPERGVSVRLGDFEEACVYLKKKYVQFGGRCFWSGFPMSVGIDEPFAVSLTRLDPTGDFVDGNVALVCKCFNGGVNGAWLNKNLSEEERKEAKERAVFNVEYFRLHTHYPTERIEEMRAREREIMKSYIT